MNWWREPSRIDDRENNVPLAEIERMAFEASAPIDARQWLKKADGIPVIAEIKRASPSKGHLSDIRIKPLWPANTSREVQARFPC